MRSFSAKDIQVDRVTSSSRSVRSCLGNGIGPGTFVAVVLLVWQPGISTATPPKEAANGKQASPIAPLPRFDVDVLPLLQSKCMRCHGEKARKADLDLRTNAGILKGGESGPAVVPGKPEESILYEKVRDGAMPPGKKNRLSEVEVARIRRWIEGAAPIATQAAAASTVVPAATVTQHDVIPILLRRCTVCHGARQQEAALDLRTRASMLRGGKSGPAIVLGKPGESLLIKKVRSGQMPPLRRLVEVSIKPIEPAEVLMVARWIELGAPEGRIEPDVATSKPDPLVTDKDREFWAFQAPRPVDVPLMRDEGRIANPIDAFILQKLRQKGLTFSPEADRAVLMRRVYLDLTGLPPEPSEVRAFLTDSRPLAYETMVDRLLASPRYGERWGRHWLDLAGYADSEGKREQDLQRPYAYCYRDYVIKSFNADKSHDRFLLEQIAGDELFDYEHAPEITPEMYDALVATGFMRMAPDPTWYNLTNFIPDRLDVMADQIEVLSSTVMGLTMKCARCHSHKFDPIPQRDYYRLMAVFKGAFDEYDWMKSNWHPTLSMGQRSDRDLAYVTTSESRQRENYNAELQKQINALRSSLDKECETIANKYFEERLGRLPASIRHDVRTALNTAGNKRTAVQAYLVDKFEKSLRPGRQEILKIDAGLKKQVEESERQNAELEAKRLPAPKIRALWDRGEPSPTYLYRRGDYLSPGQLVGPGVPSVLTDGKTPFEVKPPWPGARKTGRRLAFARWLTNPQHPLTARVMVNRIWMHHFGTGLVKTLDNFGKNGAGPTHPELLDWLALEFVRQEWSIKAMHRLMVNSATYRQSSIVMPIHERLDPDNALYSRMPLQRMSAEQLFDTLLLAAGRLDETRYGPPEPVEARKDGLVSPVGTVKGWRRSIYLEQQRKVVVSYLENFDFPQMNPNCVERRNSTVAPQALHLMNNGMVQELAEHFARRLQNEASDDSGKQIESVYLIAFSRLPTSAEKSAGLEALVRLRHEWSRHLEATKNPMPDAGNFKALVTYCHAIINSAEFIYID